MRVLELRIQQFRNSLESEELFSGSGSSLYGQIFREFINITLDPAHPINASLSEKVHNYLLSLEMSQSVHELSNSKGYLQLLCFYLSYRNHFETYQWKESKPKAICMIPVRDFLRGHGCDKGLPGSGNFAMFFAILIYNDSQNVSDNRLDEWFDIMDQSMNQNGLWGIGHITYQMQNGYHQYEIYNFFNRKPRNELDYNSILKSQDSIGHFGPCVGGGGCYDYDAVSLLCRSEENEYVDKSLTKLYNSLSSEQNTDGGFCESPYIGSFFKSLIPVIKFTVSNFNIPRLKSAIRFLFLHTDYIQLKTHWSPYHRKFYQSDLWNTWFRLLTVYKIEARLKNTRDRSKVFKYPGIGF
jgi:hypothetical protein